MLSSVLQDFDWDSRTPSRLFHGRGQSQAPFKSISIDWLPPVLLVTLYKPVDDAMLQAWLDEMLTNGADKIESVLLQRRYLQPPVFEWLRGKPVTELVVTEAGLSYQLVFGTNLHTGLFLDMAVARRWVRQHAKEKKILNLFSYSCAFSVAAIAGNAKSVLNMDMSRQALSRGRDNHRLNNQNLSRVSFFAHDIFRSWGKLKRQGPYDLVVVDPPSYQPGSFVAERDYARILRRLPDMLAVGAQLLFCSNDPARSEIALRQLIEAENTGFVFQQRLENPAGFEDVDSDRALKVILYQFLPAR